MFYEIPEAFLKMKGKLAGTNGKLQKSRERSAEIGVRQDLAAIDGHVIEAVPAAW